MIDVALTAPIVDRMRALLRRAGRREIGGVLMGQEVGAGRFVVADFSVDEVSGERAHFVRDADHHKVALDAFFERTGHDYSTFNYLGEWHSHPSFSVRPSGTDLRSMQELVEGDRGIEFAVLVIVKLGIFRSFTATACLHRRGLKPEPVLLTAE